MSNTSIPMAFVGLLCLSAIAVGCGGAEPTGDDTQQMSDEEALATRGAPARLDVARAESTGSTEAAEAAASSMQIAPLKVGACSSGVVCFYRDSNFGPAGESHGELAQASSNVGVYSHPGCQTGNWNDCISSVKNNTKTCWGFFENSGYWGTYFLVKPGQSYSNLGWANDMITSMKPMPGKC
jgi:hypothetical protein